MIKVVHVKKSPYDFYIGRYNSAQGLKASPLANPFKITKQTTRDDVLDLYSRWLSFQIEVQNHQVLTELVKILNCETATLGCWCSPQLCHGDVIAKFLTDPEVVSKLRSYEASLL
jgi:hypothetical protein